MLQHGVVKICVRGVLIAAMWNSMQNNLPGIMLHSRLN